ncbi:MAG: YfhO family protein [Clostridia bacterium]|nr:YfhO family protein [Clostridia bacterium]
MEPEINTASVETAECEAIQLNESPVLRTDKKSIVLRVVAMLLAVILPIIIMGEIVFSGIDSVNKRRNEQEIALEESRNASEAQEKNQKERDTFLYSLKTTLYGNGVFSTSILAGVQRDIDDAKALAEDYIDRKYILTNHFDPFFPVLVHYCKINSSETSLNVKESAKTQTETVEYRVALSIYVLRFGLASLAMFCFAAFAVKLSNGKSVLLALVYSLSSINLIFAQNSSIMNLAIIVPLVMISVACFVRKSSFKTFVLFSLCSAVMFVSGIYGVIFGIPFVIVFSYLYACCAGLKLSRCFKYALQSLPATLIGLGISCPIWIIWFTEYHLTSAEPVFSVRYTFMDFLYRFFAFTAINPSYDVSKTAVPTGDLSITDMFKSGSLGNNAHDINLFRAPSMYFSLVALLLLVLFFISKSISSRARISAAVIIFIYHLSYALIPLDLICNIFDMGTVMGMVRFVFVNAILVFLVSLSLENIEEKLHDMSLALYIVLGFIVVANAVFDGDKANSVKLIFNFFVPIILYFVIKNFSRSSIAVWIAVLLTAAELAFVTDVNFKTSVIATNYTVNPLFEKETRRAFDTFGVEDIKLLGEENDLEYACVSYDSVKENDSILGLINGIFSEKYEKALFRPLPIENTYTECLDCEGDVYSISDSDYGKVIQVLSSDCIPSDARIVLYSQYNEKSHYNIMDTERNGIIAKSGSENGTFIIDITSEIRTIGEAASSIQIEYDVMNNSGDNRFEYGIYYATNQDIEKYNELFVKGSTMVDGERRLKVITNCDYQDSVKVSIDLSNYDTYNCCGKLAFDIDSSELSGHDIDVYDKNTAEIFSYAVSFITVTALAALTVNRRFVIRKNRKEVGNDSKNE